MSLSRELATLNDEQLRAALRVLANKMVAGGGDVRRFDGFLRPVSHAFHAAGWTKERLNEFRRTARHEFSKAQKELAATPRTNEVVAGESPTTE